MIDSSEHIVEIDELIGFDLERARGLRDFLQDDCAEVGDVWGEMIAEIERLRADLEQAEICIRARMECIDDQAAYIKELESSLDEAEALTKKNAELMNGYLGRIAELEDALVEGLTNFLHYRASCYDPARRCPYAKECDDCSTWNACGHVEKFRSEARRRLQAEGKIGNGDHIAETDQMVPCWQITEERKAAIDRGLQFLEWSYAKNSALDTKEQIAVLWAMLDEVGQEIKNIKTVEI